MFSCDEMCGYDDGVDKAIELIELLMLQGKSVTVAIDYVKSYDHLHERPPIEHQHVWKQYDYSKKKVCKICSLWIDVT